jgi:hypothetical protein
MIITDVVQSAKSITQKTLRYAHAVKSLQGPSQLTQLTEKNIIIGLYV